jgi:deoxyribodipyrimidine photo-lyase
MESTRQLIITDSTRQGAAVIYVMSRDQRVQANHALLAAQAHASEKNIPLYVLFVLKNIKSRSYEHYKFMLEGLEEVSRSLATYNIQFVLKSGDPAEAILQTACALNAEALFFDFSPLTGARSLVKKVGSEFSGSVTVVDTHNIIPAWVVSDKKEFAAHTMRSKVHKKLETYLVKPAALQKQTLVTPKVDSLTFKDAYNFIERIPQSGITIDYQSGEQASEAQLKEFILYNLEHYALSRNNIALDHQSGFSPYLHYGQISSLQIALSVIDAVGQVPLLLQKPKLSEHGDVPSQEDGMNALLEEMIVRKELADNFCLYSEDYLTIMAAPEWAQKSLLAHSEDPRDFVYSTEQWESARTHDAAWNAAQSELITSGKMHGYMRMYWAKKILEWSPSPEKAIEVAIYLNDKYSIDGGDPNGYVGILWSIAGLHDRPWFERPVFGKIRYMNEAGLKRKFAVDEYIKRVGAL